MSVVVGRVRGRLSSRTHTARKAESACVGSFGQETKRIFVGFDHCFFNRMSGQMRAELWQKLHSTGY